MLRCVASKRRMRLLNKLNKSSIIHPGPGVCLAHADQRHAPAACNIPHWKHGSAGKRQQLAVSTVLRRQSREPGANRSATPVHTLFVSAGTWRHDMLSLQHLLHLFQQTGPIVGVNIWCNVCKHWWIFMKPWVSVQWSRELWKMPTAAVLSVHHHVDLRAPEKPNRLEMSKSWD